MTLLQVDRLSLAIGAFPVLREVSFEMREGEVFGLIGESGSGKSMTALALMGLAPEGAAVGGRAALAGRDLLSLGEKRLQQVRGAEIGLVFQEPATALNPLLTIGDQVAETARIHGAARPREARRLAGRALARVGLERIPPDRYPHELSGGQRQRVVIAMATCLRPKLLIADEPTTALDVTTQARILALLRRLAEEDGMGLLLITHDLGVVAGLAHRVAVMREGRVVEAGETARVLRAPAHPYTRTLRDAARRPPAAARALGAAPPVLEIDGAVRSYPAPRAGFWARRERRRVLHGVSLRVRAGETVALVGESGSGKTTLARAALGLDRLDAGSVRLAGEPLPPGDGWPRRLQARIQAVFQDPYASFDPRWRVGRAVAEPFHLLDAPPSAAERAARVAEALREVGLAPSDAERYPHEFSGGQRQRLAIARALILRPALVVLDEAVSALDVSIRAQVLDLLADLQRRRGCAYLFIAHDLAVVRAVADRVAVMKDGEIVEEAPCERLFEAPAHPYTRALLAASPDLDAALAGPSALPA